MQISLHLGVHKTATTYLQRTLEANRGLLQGSGVAFVPHKQVRASLTARLRDRFSNLSSTVTILIRQHNGCRRLILSDENLIGLGGDAVRDGAYYASIQERAERLIRSFAADQLQIFIAVRSYESFVSSMYTEYIRHYAFISPEEYLAAVDIQRLDWCNLVGSICDLVGAEHVTFWRFEDFREFENRILSQMTGGVAIESRRPRRLVRPSLSQRAVNTLSSLRPLLGRKVTRRMVSPVAAVLPKRAGSPAFCAFDEKDAAALRNRYARDLTRLETEYPQLTVIGPPSEA